MCSHTVFENNMSFPSACFGFIECMVLLLSFFTVPNSLLSFHASISTFWPVHATTLLTNANTCSLVTPLYVLSIPITSCMLPVIIYAINNLFFFFCFLSFDLNPYSLAFILRWQIHSLAFLFGSLGYLQYLNDKIASLCWSMNLSPNTLNNPMFVPHCLASHHSEFAWAWTPPGIGSSVLLRPSHFPVCYSCKPRKCSLPLSQSYKVPDIFELLNSPMWVAWSMHSMYWSGIFD